MNEMKMEFLDAFHSQLKAKRHFVVTWAENDSMGKRMVFLRLLICFLPLQSLGECHRESTMSVLLERLTSSKSSLLASMFLNSRIQEEFEKGGKQNLHSQQTRNALFQKYVCLTSGISVFVG